MNHDYAREYDNYWSAKDRFTEKDSIDVDTLAEDILLAYGGGTLLDIGSGTGNLVRAFLRRGVPSTGIDVSPYAVNYANTLAPQHFVSASALELPFDSGSFDIVISNNCLEHLSEQDIAPALQEIRRIVRRCAHFRIATTPDRDNRWRLTIKPRDWWEKRFFEAGFRKHPAYYQINSYESLERDDAQITISLEKIPDAAWENYPLTALSEERDLHMDMFRETGARSDAHIARYQWAAQFIRPGDTVLDAACGLGYGSYLLHRMSVSRKVIGVDGSGYAVEYANLNFGTSTGIDFRLGNLPEALLDIPDNSIDVVVSFETLEHVERNKDLLEEFNRILTPGGRIIVSVPNDWSDETGQDPNPFHLHVYTLKRLKSELEEHFLLEQFASQTANQCKTGVDRKTWRKAGRSLQTVSLDQDASEPEAEWWLAVAMKSPLQGAGVAFTDTAHPRISHPAWHVTSFARDYDNPWLLRGMVDIGHRMSNKAELLTLTQTVRRSARRDSPDRGAALCASAYQLLASEATPASAITQFADEADEYLQIAPQTPHDIRWHISLLFVIGRLWLEVGDFEKATASFERCIELNPMHFSLLLCNRTIEARLILGSLSALKGDQAVATQHWQQGVMEAHNALHEDWSSAIGTLETPAEFGLPELASILEYASSCAYALCHIKEIDSKYWWWLHPRRDRLSQFKRLSKSLTGTQEELNLQAQQLGNLTEEIQRLNRILEDNHLAAQKVIAQRQGELDLQGRYIEDFKSKIRQLEESNTNLQSSLDLLYKKLSWIPRWLRRYL